MNSVSKLQMKSWPYRTRTYSSMASPVSWVSNWMLLYPSSPLRRRRSQRKRYWHQSLNLEETQLICLPKVKLKKRGKIRIKTNQDSFQMTTSIWKSRRSRPTWICSATRPPILEQPVTRPLSAARQKRRTTETRVRWMETANTPWSEMSHSNQLVRTICSPPWATLIS